MASERANEPIAEMRADQVIAAAGALADHLQRSGVQWLPVARAEAVHRLAGALAPPEAADASPIPAESRTTAAAAAGPAGSANASSQPPNPAAAEPAAGPASIRPESRLAPVAAVDVTGESYPGQPLPPEQRQPQLEAMAAEVAACTRCEALAQCRTQTVFGEGDANPRVAFFGEGPGMEEDRTGRPFVGKAGQLLTKMIEACTFAREDVYILNTVKCRPPGNRNPDPTEIDNCREYFERQLAILRPEYIVCLGAVSSQALLQSKLSVGRLRGKIHRYFDSKVVVTYHPAYLLRNPAAKKAAWADLQLMLRDAGIDPKQGR